MSLYAEYFTLEFGVSDLSQIDFDAPPSATGTVSRLATRYSAESFWLGGATDNFAARYTGQLNIDSGGTYTFYLTSDDGSALYINGEPVIDNDGLHGDIEQTVTIDLGAGSHDIEIRYFEGFGDASLQLEWSGPDSGGQREIIQGETFSHTRADDETGSDGIGSSADESSAEDDVDTGNTGDADSASTQVSGLVARYFTPANKISNLSDVDFEATPVETANVDQLAILYERGGFWEGGPRNHFAAHYAGNLNVEAGGTYTFYLTSDDGSALYIDGEPVIDNDGLHATREQRVTLELSAGSHDIEIFYFERRGAASLQLEWAGPDSDGQRQIIGGEAFSHPESTSSGDTGGDTGTGDTGSGDTGGDTGTGDSGSGDTGGDTGTGDAGSGDTGGDTGTGDSGSGDTGGDTGTGDAGSGDTGGDTGTGDAGSGDTGGDTGTGDAGSGDTGGDTGTGDSGSGDTGGDTGTGDSGSGDTGGDTGTGDSGSGDTGGDTGTGDSGSGDAWTSGLMAQYFSLSHGVSRLSDIDFDAQPSATESVDRLATRYAEGSFWRGGATDNFAARYTGNLNVATAGLYTFFLTSDDGSALYLNGEPVIDNDGLHGDVEQRVTLELDSGSHDIEIRYFERDGDASLQLEWSGPDSSDQRQVIEGEAFSHNDAGGSANSGETGGGGDTGSGDAGDNTDGADTGSGDAGDNTDGADTGSGDAGDNTDGGDTGSGDAGDNTDGGDTGGLAGSTGSISDPSIGVGLTGIIDWSTENPFIDVFKTAREWIGHEPDRWGGVEYQELLDAGVLDENGWPMEIPSGVDRIGTHILSVQPAEATSLAGRYRLTYDGEGEIAINGARNIEYGNGEIWFEYIPGEFETVGIDILRTGSDGNHIRNISVVHEDNISAFEAGEIFNPDFVELIEDMRSLRFMDWMNTNNSTQSEWADRPEVDSFSWTGGAGGVPVEVMVELANLTGTDPWFNIPHLATPEYVANFATYVRDNLDPQLKAHFEYSNEVWNWMFEQTQWANEMGQELWPGQQDAWLQYYALRSVEMAEVLDQVYGADADGRLVKVIATQTGWPGLEEPILNAAQWLASDADQDRAPHTYFDAYAVTGYFGGSLGNEKAATVREWVVESISRATADADALGLTGAERSAYLLENQYNYAMELVVQELRDGSITGDPYGSLQELFGEFAYHAQVAEAHGMTMVMYEGGTHVVSGFEWVNDQVLSEFFQHLNYSDEMGMLYMELLEGWRDAGGTMFNAFVAVSGPSQWGSWGALRHLDDETSRWDALVEFNAQNPAWWEVRAEGTFSDAVASEESMAYDAEGSDPEQLTANDDTATTITDQAVLIDVLANDDNPFDVPMDLIELGTPSNGTVLIQDDDTVLYTPDSEFLGTDSFDYWISDDQGTVSQATVTVTVEETWDL